MSDSDPIILPAVEPQLRRGERSEMIVRLKERHPQMPLSAIAKKTGCTKGNVSYVLNKYLNGVTPDELEQFRSDKPAILEAIQHRTLSSITDDDLSKASYLQKITGAAIIQDKLQLMAGLPTSIHVTALLDVAELIRKEDE